MSKWEKIGQVCIDTGTLLLCDPCKIQDIEVFDEHDKMIEDDAVSRQIKDNCKPESHNSAILLETGIGDGYYDVDVKKDGDGLIYEMRMRFCAR